GSGVGDGRVEGGKEELLLAGEVVVERFAGDVGAADDVGDLGRLVSLLGAKFGHRVDHPPSLVGGDELGWKLGPGSRHGCSRSRLGSMGVRIPSVSKFVLRSIILLVR